MASKLSDVTRAAAMTATKMRVRPEGMEPVEWLLLTNLPVQSAKEAQEKVQWYVCRWQIEVYFRILKSGCKVEELQLQERDRLEVALALYMIVAWRVLYLIMLGRTLPELSCEVVLASSRRMEGGLSGKRETKAALPTSAAPGDADQNRSTGRFSGP